MLGALKRFLERRFDRLLDLRRTFQFRAIADAREFTHSAVVTDPFQAKFSAKLLPVIGFLLVVGVVIYVMSRTVWHTAEPDGMMIEALIIGVGSRPVAKFGNEPVFDVQLQDGTTHKVFGKKTEAIGCKIGSRISLVSRRGGGLRIGIRSCQLR